MAQVSAPTLPPFILQGSGKHRYVCTYKNVWVNGQVRRRPGSTVTVGKFELLDEETGRGECLFYDAFIEKYPELKHFRVFRSRGGKLEFQPKDDEAQAWNPTVEEVQKIKWLQAGAVWALDQIVAGSPITSALHQVFGDSVEREARLLCLAYFGTIELDDDPKLFDSFVKSHALPYRLHCIFREVKALLLSVTRQEVQAFKDALRTQAQALHDKTMADELCALTKRQPAATLRWDIEDIGIPEGQPGRDLVDLLAAGIFVLLYARMRAYRQGGGKSRFAQGKRKAAWRLLRFLDSVLVMQLSVRWYFYAVDQQQMEMYHILDVPVPVQGVDTMVVGEYVEDEFDWF